MLNGGENLRILVVIGTRPEAVKMLPLVIELRKHVEFEVMICHSGQHAKMAEEVFEYFGIAPHFCFDAMKNGQSLSEMTCRLLNYFNVLFDEVVPDIILVQGDTTSAFCASLSAFYKRIRVGHIEAGLRTFKARSPFPEEFNRVAIDSMSDYHFAPTYRACENLKKEGRKSVFTVGNTVIDALKYTVRENYSSSLLECARERKIVLITTHRRENIGKKMLSSLIGIRNVLVEREELFAILPMHPNPLAREVISAVFEGVKNISICEPLALYDFHNILARAFCVFTDSGGVQEEASYLGVPVFILRDTTERQEALESGNARLVGTEREDVARALENAIANPDFTESMRKCSTAFGDGHASEKIVKALLQNFKL